MSESDKPTDASFLSRWSRRKSEAALPAAAPATSDDPQAEPTSSTGAPAGEEMPETPHPEPTLPAERPVKQALPSIDSLTHEADFSPFMARDVDPALRNQAMKKLFTHPHYQFAQMDKLDIYIDDYSQPDPIPLGMLRKMNQAKSLFLFDEEVKDAPLMNTAATSVPDSAGAAVSAGPPAPSVASEAGTSDDGASDETGAEKSGTLPKDLKENVELIREANIRKPA